MSEININNTVEELLVSSRTERIIVNPETRSVAIVYAGPIGPRGFDGFGGLPEFFEYSQVTPSTSWLINHNLGYKPNVDVRDENGVRLRVGVIHHTDNQTEVQTLTPRVGTATLS